MIYAAERISQLVKQKKLQDIVCVPTSFQSIDLIRKGIFPFLKQNNFNVKLGGLTLGDLSNHPSIDVAVDGADEVDEYPCAILSIFTTLTPSNDLNCIKGGGGCQTQEKIIAYNSKKFYVVCRKSE